MNNIEHVALDPNYHWRIRLLADAIHEVLGVRDAVDIGCGEGMLAARLAEHGWKIQGADGSPRAVAGHVPGIEVELHDLAKPNNPAGRHECVICTETAEHIPEEFADNVVANVAASGRSLMVWSAAKPGQLYPGHVNLQPREYWLEKLARYGWKLDEVKTAKLRERMVALGAQHAGGNDNFCVLERAVCLVVVSTCFKSPTETMCRASVSMQTLKAPHVFIDAALQAIPKTHSENLYDAVKILHPDDVVVQLDGDDWLAHPHVLEQIAGLYVDPEVWLTYGSVLMTDGTYNGNNMPYGPNEDIRTSRWRCSHLKTFRAGLFQLVNPEDFMFEGEWTSHAVDHATMFPMVEMAGWDRTRWVKEAIYVYNFENSVEFRNPRRNAIALRAAEYFRNRPRYSRLSTYRSAGQAHVSIPVVATPTDAMIRTKESKMKIHVLGVPHTKTTPEFSTCAFTQKTLTLCKMLTRRGHHVIHYGVEGSNPECTENVSVMPHDVWAKQFSHPGKEFYKTDVSGEFAPYHARYAANLRAAILNRTGDPYTEIICHPWNGTQPEATEGIPQYRVESGIGYRGAWAPWRVYESYAWLHMHLGAEGTWHGGKWYWNVIPNAFDLTQFAQPKSQRSGDFLYLGRLNFDKGVGIACDTAKAVGARITIVGQGDPDAVPGAARDLPSAGRDRGTQGALGKRASLVRADDLRRAFRVDARGGDALRRPGHHERLRESSRRPTSTALPATAAAPWNSSRGPPRTSTASTAGSLRKWARDNFAMERVVLQYEEFFDQCLRVRDMNGPVDGPTGFYGLNPERTELDSLRRYYPGLEKSEEKPVITQKPLPEISFVVRAHNEEASLRESITSLFPIEKPIEIVVILHRCTDGSKEIALNCQAEAPPHHKVKIVEYDVPISRAGLETFVTPEDSPHSIMSYYNWAFSQASSAWRFKWDADLVGDAGLHRVGQRGRGWTIEDSPSVQYASPFTGRRRGP